MNNRILQYLKGGKVDPEDYVGHDAGRNERRARERFVATAKRYLSQIPLANETVAMYFAMLDPATPVWVKGTVAAALAYFVLPFDAIPDLLPLVGMSDDASVLAAAVATVSAYVNDEHRRKAREWMAHEHLVNPRPEPTRV